MGGDYSVPTSGNGVASGAFLVPPGAHMRETVNPAGQRERLRKVAGELSLLQQDWPCPRRVVLYEVIAVTCGTPRTHALVAPSTLPA